MRPADRARGGLRQAEVQHLARLDQVLDGAGDVFDRHLGVDPVLVVQVDPVGAQPAQRVVDRTPDAVRTAAQSARLRPVLGEREPELGRDPHLVPQRLEGLPDDVLIGERAVHLRGVEERDAEFGRATDHRDPILPCRSAGGAVGAGQAHAAVADLRDGQAGAQGSLLHGFPFTVR
jgi:hypothetical protein